MNIQKITYEGRTYWNVPENGEGTDLPQSVLAQAIIDEKWKAVRTQRDNCISATDWTQIPDAQLTDEKKAEFLAYRQELRDIPQKYTNPDDVVWPEKPTI
ncbi:tail fiber assembly protein [Vibrio crassostreae]|uniref:tail fiber assembly protein n=1 Tax=Vibrio crassostreae TaxID=246167 RepID=UPI001B300AB1|nr:tail fiber assembly protein [Vibrio crassostreae]